MGRGAGPSSEAERVTFVVLVALAASIGFALGLVHASRNFARMTAAEHRMMARVLDETERES